MQLLAWLVKLQLLFLKISILLSLTKQTNHPPRSTQAGLEYNQALFSGGYQFPVDRAGVGVGGE